MNKFLTLYYSLLAAEKRKIREGLASPFFNKNNKLIVLYAIIEASPQEDGDVLKQQVHEALFPGTPYDDLVIRHLCSKLLKKAEELLVHYGYQQQPTKNQLGTTALYADKQLDLHYASANRQLEKQIEAEEEPKLDDYQLLIAHTQIKERFAEQQESRRQSTQLQQLNDHIDKYYFLAKLKLACSTASYQRVFKQQYDVHLIDELLQLADTIYKNDDLIRLYSLAYRTLGDGDAEKAFKQLKKGLADTPKAHPNELRDLHTLAQNFCIRQVNSGAEAYFKQLFDLYKISLEQELILHDATQFPPAFKNMVSVALRLKEVKWVEKFIKHYSQYLEEESRDDHLNYNLARLNFELGRYEKVGELIMQMPFNDLFITLNARMLQIKASVELAEDQLALSLIDSFRQFLQRRKKLGYHQRNFLNNIRYTKRIIYLSNKEKDRNELRKRIEQEEQLTERRWLLGKLA